MNPRCVENELNGDMNISNPNVDMNNGCMCPPIYECPTERVCERVIMHEVPQE